MAALWKALKWISISLLLFMLVLTPLVQSSRTPFLGRATTMVAQGTATAKQELEKSSLVKKCFRSRGGWSAADLRSVEDSAREVPTGPDPLHHNDNPTRP